jgi:hypothetical protein
MAINDYRPMEKYEYKRIAEEMGRAAAMTSNDEQTKGVALAIHYLVGVFALHDSSFDSEEFRSQADASYEVWKEQRRKEIEAGKVLAKMAKHQWAKEKKEREDG